jgi:hypothetical protein
MKNALAYIFLVSIFVGCGDGSFDPEHLENTGGINPQESGSDCTPEVLESLSEVLLVCGKQPLTPEDKALCFSMSDSYIQSYNGVVCVLESGSPVVTSTLVSELVDSLKNETDRLIESGIFD